MSDQQPAKSDGISTIASLVNTMVGGTILALPILFRDAGIIDGLILLTISGTFAYKTCVLYAMHMSDKQKNMEQTVQRISGVKWGRFFKGLIGYILLFLSIIFMSLIQDRIYGITYFILQTSDHTDWIAPKNASTLVFDKFSRQYLSLIMIIPVILLISLRKIMVIIKLSAFGSISFIIFVLFILYEFFSNVSDINTDDIRWFSTDIGNLAGTCAFSFTIHPTAGPILKNQSRQQNNRKYLVISYITAYSIYLIICIFGAFSVLQKQCTVTILNCYQAEWQALIVQISYFIGLLTVFPTFVEVSRTTLLQFYIGSVQKNHFKLYNLAFSFVCTIFIFFSPYFPLDLLLNLFGSILCYFLIYLIPAKFHWDCLYGKRQKKSLLESDENITYSVISQEPLNKNKYNQSQTQQPKCFHDDDYADRYSKIGRIILYATLNLFGITVGIYSIYQFFTQVFGSSYSTDVYSFQNII